MFALYKWKNPAELKELQALWLSTAFWLGWSSICSIQQLPQNEQGDCKKKGLHVGKCKPVPWILWYFLAAKSLKPPNPETEWHREILKL